MFERSNRRAFLAASGSAAAALVGLAHARAEALASAPAAAPSGPFYARVGAGGLRAGTCVRPSRGPVWLLDGRSVEVEYHGSTGLEPGRCVYVTPEGPGSWAVLYAEV